MASPIPTMSASSLPPPLPLPPPASAPVAVPLRPALWAAGAPWAPACATDCGGGGGIGGSTSSVGDGEPPSNGSGSVGADTDADTFVDNGCGNGDGKGGTGGGAQVGVAAPAVTVPFVSGESPVTPEAGWVEAALGATHGPHGLRRLRPPSLASPVGNAVTAPVLTPPPLSGKASSTAMEPPRRPRRPDTRRSRGEFTRRLLLSSMGW